MTRAGRREMLRRELDRARNDVSPIIYDFAQLCERHPTPSPKALAKAARDLYLKVGGVAAFAEMLAREVRS